MISRRDILSTGTLAALSHSVDTRRDNVVAVKDVDNIIRILSPKDGFIERVYSHSGTSIASGDQLLSIDQDAEKRTVERLKMAQELSDIEKEALGEGNVARQRSSLKLALDVATEYQKSTKSEYDQVKARKRFGTAEDQDVLNFGARSFRADAEVTRAQLAQTNFEFSLAQARKRFTVVAKRVSDEMAVIGKQIDQLTMRAPVAGVVTQYVVQGVFVLKGSLIADITIKS